ncbi:phage virion morphogenesis protein [Capnocytophaga granulosa]|uniref:phage virion morphogenesis protein n=1 Tax=Capnocytophaga granulosa TaxID=45242 RepID=UPI0023F3F595|nr:phage virion morphogenesis protein [Capnocytophaga granulosa]
MANFQTPNFESMAREIFKSISPKVSQKARAFFLQSFIKQGFTDTSFIPWVKRVDALPHKLLSQSLTLKNSLRIAEQSSERVVISAGEKLSYAAIHNEGGTITVKVTEKMRKYFWAMYYKTQNSRYKWMALTEKETLTIHIPKRQFIGESYTLDRQLEKLIIEEILQAEKHLTFE